MPEVSIITVNLNNAEGLKNTMRSVLTQSFSDYEYIVIDGGSTDGSTGVISSAAGKLAYWVSEKDAGIYNAMNKGIQKAKGNYLLFLNSGDHFIGPEVLNELIKTGNGADLIYSDMILQKDGKETQWTLPSRLSFSFFLNSSLPHASCLIKRSLFNKIGLYSEHYKIVSDWEFFFLAVHKYQCTYKHVPINCVIFNLEGISTKDESSGVIANERAAVIEQHFSSLIPEFEKLDKLESEKNKRKRNIFFRMANKIYKLANK